MLFGLGLILFALPPAIRLTGKLYRFADPERWALVQASTGLNNPSGTVLNSEVVPRAFHALSGAFSVLLLSGCLVLVGWRGARREYRKLVRIRTWPDEPWKHDGWWENGIVEAFSWRFWLWPAFGFLVVCLPFPLLYAVRLQVVPDAPADHSLFIAISVCWAAWLLAILYDQWRQWRFGRPHLLLPNVPLEPGGTYDCTLALRRPLRGTEPIRVTLTCRSTSMSFGRPDTTIFESRTLLARDGKTTAEARIPLRIEVPAGLPHRVPMGAPGYRWELDVFAREPGPNLRAHFELPVYRTRSHLPLDHAQIITA
jgi:hypothetical protein